MTRFFIGSVIMILAVFTMAGMLMVGIDRNFAVVVAGLLLVIGRLWPGRGECDGRKITRDIDNKLTRIWFEND